MRFSIVAPALLAASTTAAVLPSSVKDAIAPIVSALAPKLPLTEFPPNPFIKPLTLDEAKNAKLTNETENDEVTIQSLMTTAATCSKVRIRYDWDTASTTTRNAFINAVKCLMDRPASGRFSQARNRYEDFVALHQQLTPNVHGNAKFLLWHRYYVWAFEDVLRTECGFNNDLPWFDETKYAGNFASSSIFSSSYFGSINLGGNCVTNGQFAGRTLNVGPSTSNRAHCLARNNDNSKTANTNSNIVNACNARTSYADMAACAEGGAHAWGHNGIGAVMQDVYASPGDPVFWLHHMFIDRNFRIWQNGAASRTTSINGNDGGGNRLTLDTTISLNGIRPDIKIRDVLNTRDGKLCYQYNY